MNFFCVAMHFLSLANFISSLRSESIANMKYLKCVGTIKASWAKYSVQIYSVYNLLVTSSKNSRIKANTDTAIEMYYKAYIFLR